MSMNNPFSDVQNSILIGSLLGDGHLTRPRSGDSAFVKNQCAANLDYLQWHHQQFEQFACPIRPGNTIIKGKTYFRNTLYVKAHPILTNLRHQWYPDGTKVVPSNLVLSPLALAIWYFDDGSNIFRSRRASFATYCFSRTELEHLTSLLLRQFQISCTINSKNVIVVRAESYKRLIDLVSPYMLWHCFQHKIAYRDSMASPSCKSHFPKVLFWHKRGKPICWISSKLGVSKASIYNQLLRYRKNSIQVVLPLNNTSGVKGICYDHSRRKWVAHLTIAGRRHCLGRFSTIDAARNAMTKSNLEESQHSNTYRK